MVIRYLIIALTTRCNLKCRYCYVNASSKGVDMKKSVLLKAMELAENSAESQKVPLHVQLTGGEPTLVPDLVEMACHQAKETAQRRSRPLSMAIQTNATALTPDLISLFKRFNIQVGVSLDGPPKVQESLRGKAALTLRGLQLLESERIPFRVTTVVSHDNVAHLHRLMWVLAGFSQARGMGLDLLVNKGRAMGDERITEAAFDHVRSADHDELRQGVEAMLKALKEINLRRSIPLQLRELELVKNQQKRGKNKKAFCHACQGESVAVHPDGRLFPCGQTLEDPGLQAGTVWQPETKRLHILKDAAALFDSHASDPPTACRSCPLKGRCPGECPSRLYYNGKNKDQDDRRLICTLYGSLTNAI